MVGCARSKGATKPSRARSSVAELLIQIQVLGERTHSRSESERRTFPLLVEGRRAYGGAQFGSRSWQAAIGRVRSADRSNLRFHVSRTVADTVSNSYGSEGFCRRSSS